MSCVVYVIEPGQIICLFTVEKCCMYMHSVLSIWAYLWMYGEPILGHFTLKIDIVLLLTVMIAIHLPNSLEESAFQDLWHGQVCSVLYSWSQL